MDGLHQTMHETGNEATGSTSKTLERVFQMMRELRFDDADDRIAECKRV